jgi:ABC-type Mn2+/Zn2+ transport system permease subunit
MDINHLLLLSLVGVAVASAASYLGSFMVLKRMSLVGDALSHVALPGMAIAISLSLSPMIGAFVSLTLAALTIWYLEETSEVYPETLVGILFTTGLAIGVLITQEPDLLEALFGNIETVTPMEGTLSAVLSLATVFLTYKISPGLTVSVLSDEMAKSAGYQIKRVNLLYLILVATVVALGVKFVGTLLTGALVIVPAAAARNISRGITSYQFLSIIFGSLSAITGILLSEYFRLPTGPLVVLTSTVFFLTTYIAKKSARS